MTYREKEKAANGTAISQSYDGCCSTAEICGVHMMKTDPVAYSDKQVSLEESVHSDIAKTTMEPTSSDTSNGVASSSTRISCKIGSRESYEGEKDDEEEEVVVVLVGENENIVNGRFCEITENLSHESRDEGEERFHISPNHEEDESHHTLANGNFSICVSSPNRSHSLHDSHKSHESHETRESHQSHGEEEGIPLVSSAHEEDESHHTLANGNLSISVASPNMAHDSHDSHESHEVKKAEQEGIPLVSSHHEEDESHHTLANGNLSVCVSSPNKLNDSHDSHKSHYSNDSHNSYEVKKKPEDEEEGIPLVSSDNEEDESHHTAANGIHSTCRSHDSYEFEGVKALNKPIKKGEEIDFSGISSTIEDRLQNYDGTKESHESHKSHPGSLHLVEVESHESCDSHEEEVENRGEPIDEDKGDGLPQGVVLDQITNSNGFSTFFPTQASILGIKFGSVDCDEFLVLNSGFRFPGPSPIYHVNINGGSEVDATVHEWNGSEAGLVVEPEAGLVVEPEAGLVVEPEAGVVVEPEAGVVVETEADVVFEPEADVVFEPEAGVVFEPEAGVVFEPEAGVVVEPEAGVVVEPEAGVVLKPEAGVVVVPEAGVVVKPDSGVVVEPEAGVVIEADAGVAVDPEVGLVVEEEWAMDDEAIANGSEVGDMPDGEDTQTKLEKRGFYYLIKIPRFSDDDIREKMKNCQLLVHEKTRIRDDIRSKIQDIRTSCKEHGDKIEMAISEEKSARDALRCKRREIDSVMNVINKVKTAISIDDIDAKIREIEHTMEHGSLKLTEEKKLIHEIKQLKRQRDQLAANLDKNEDLDQAFAEKDNMDKQLKELRKEVVCLRDEVSKMEQMTKEARKGYFGEREKLNELQSEFKEADNARQLAYTNLLDERKHLSDKNKYFRMYKENSESAYGYAAANNKEELENLCINQVEKVMLLWNTNEEFRSQYIRANTRSTLWRLKTPDGRSLSPDHAPTPAITLPKTHPPETASSLPPSNTKLEDERRTPQKKRRKSAEQKHHTAAEERRTAEERLRAAEEEERRRTAEEEERRRTAEEEERRRTAEEERRREERAAKKKEEEKTKEKEAEQRKRRNAEKARVRAEARALKEAQQKEKEREKRLRKKERKKRAAVEVSGDGEIESPVTIPLPEENPTRENVEICGRPGTGKRTEPRKAAKGPPRVLLKNRGKRRVRHFLWAVPLFIFVIFTIGIVVWAHNDYRLGF